MDETPPQPVPVATTPPVSPNAGPPNCANCGYSLRGLSIDTNCPECGTPVLYSISGDSRSNGFAVASLVLGICSIFLGCSSYGLLGLICGPLALMYHNKAVAKVASGKAPASTLGLARAGRICGWIGLGMGLLVILMLAFFLALGVVMPLFAPGGGGLGP